ncbi:DUF2829 domain-containing protein [Xenorhabdus budapestensis]|uniref:DUF2829 domain-containing protein n=1 Tax=Xenorhabdus budapestensis TaxID=290110 RepID=A0ABX7VM14_XENBU|nr:DUF2829 domain-containing protein [Xenorhabdus budapestensis]QTL40627.1 DUF2829 domain-containing protein [Xenorhabdus budapestensis]
MSEFIKPEHECPFDPKQYHCDCFIAPVGSFSWALIQLKLRKRVTRSVWVNCQGNNEMYLAITPRVNNLAVEKDSAYAVDGVAVGTKYDYLTHIDLRNEHGNFVPWQPTQEDMMACDWQFVEEKEGESEKPKPPSNLTHQLKAKLIVGEHTDSSSETQFWGYANVMGEWEEISNNTPFSKGISQFSVIKFKSSSNYDFLLNSVGSSSEDRIQLGSERLIVRCLNKEYDLGKAEIDSVANLVYKQSEDLFALEEIIISSVGKTLEIELNFFTE